VELRIPRFGSSDHDSVDCHRLCAYDVGAREDLNGSDMRFFFEDEIDPTRGAELDRPLEGEPRGENRNTEEDDRCRGHRDGAQPDPRARYKMSEPNATFTQARNLVPPTVPSVGRIHIAARIAPTIPPRFESR